MHVLKARGHRHKPLDTGLRQGSLTQIGTMERATSSKTLGYREHSRGEFCSGITSIDQSGLPAEALQNVLFFGFAAYGRQSRVQLRV